jgi:hypothetical protein
MKPPKIMVHIDSNEAGSSRAKALALAVTEDPRFELVGFAELEVDVQFTSPLKEEHEKAAKELIEKHGMENVKVVIGGPDIYNAELKEPSDYVITVLGKDGHGYQQYLAMAEAGWPCMFLVLGSDEDVHMAILDALKTRYRGKELAFQIGSYEKRLVDFEANAEALGCPVERWQAMPYTRLLSRVAKRLLGASLMDYRPRPLEGERQTAALAILLGSGVGPAKAAAILEKFSLQLTAKWDEDADCEYVLTDCEGIGKTLEKRIREKIFVVDRSWRQE